MAQTLPNLIINLNYEDVALQKLWTPRRIRNLINIIYQVSTLGSLKGVGFTHLKIVFILYECIYHIGFIKELLGHHEFYKLVGTVKVYGIFFCKQDRMYFYLIQMFYHTRDGTVDFLQSFLIILCILVYSYISLRKSNEVNAANWKNFVKK